MVWWGFNDMKEFGNGNVTLSTLAIALPLPLTPTHTPHTLHSTPLELTSIDSLYSSATLVALLNHGNNSFKSPITSPSILPPATPLSFFFFEMSLALIPFATPPACVPPSASIPPPLSTSLATSLALVPAHPCSFLSALSSFHFS